MNSRQLAYVASYPCCSTKQSYFQINCFKCLTADQEEFRAGSWVEASSEDCYRRLALLGSDLAAGLVGLVAGCSCMAVAVNGCLSSD